MNFEKKYSPTSFDEVVFPSDLAESLVRRAANTLDMNLILHGNAGTGKSTCASLIPTIALQKMYNDPTITIADADNDVIDLTGMELDANGLANLDAMLSLVCLNRFRKHVIVIDEADRILPKAMGDLKIVMDRTIRHDSAVWIMCTNDISKFTKPVKSRSRLVRFDHFDISKLRSRASDILIKEGVSLPDKNIDQLCRQSCGDLRKLNQYLEDVVYA
jgi:DNA polymerase III delta prime subunit